MPGKRWSAWSSHSGSSRSCGHSTVVGTLNFTEKSLLGSLWCSTQTMMMAQL